MSPIFFCPLCDSLFWHNFEFLPRCLTIGATRHRTEKVEAAIQTATETGTEIETEIETEGEDTDTEDHQLTPQAAKETEEDGDTDRMRAALCAPEGISHPVCVKTDACTFFWNIVIIFLWLLFRSRSFDNRSADLRAFDRRYCEGYRRLDPSRDRDRDRERDPHGGPPETYYQRDFSPNMYDYRRGRERERERDESYRRKGSRRKHKRRRRRTRSYSRSSSVSTVRPKML